MKTNRILTVVFSAFMMMGLGMGVASCSDSDNNENGADNLVSTLTLDEKVARFGVETEMESAVVPLNVACKGAWSVAVEKGKDWVSIENNQVFYQGSQTLQLLFDENRTEVDRTAILYITNDAEETQTVTLRQTALYNGEAPSNSNIQTFGGKGLGCGINVGQIFRDQTKAAPGKFNPLAIHKLNNVFNLGRIESLMDNGKFSGEQPYIEEVLERGEASIVKWDSLVQKGRKLKATLNLEISFGFFNLKGFVNGVLRACARGLDEGLVRRANRIGSCGVVPDRTIVFDLEPEEAAEFLADLGLEKSGLEVLAQAAYRLLGLQSYFTAGEMEVKAWTIPVGAKAPQAAGVIHSDFERGFIKAQVCSYEDYVSLGGEQGCKNAGRMRMEGKDYVVQDGDVMHFMFNV